MSYSVKIICYKITTATFFALIFALTTAYASSASLPPIDLAEEYLKRTEVSSRLQSDGVGLMGDSVDPNYGHLRFEHVDVSLPGNSGLEVAIRRSISQGVHYNPFVKTGFGNWHLEVPRISMLVGQKSSGITVDPPQRDGLQCSGAHVNPPIIVLPTGPGNPGIDPNIDPDYIVDGWDYSNGMNLIIPGAGSQQVIHGANGNQWETGTVKTTTANWAISCIANIGTADQNDGGEGFIAKAPNGDTYRFDKLVFREATPMAVGSGILHRSHAIMLATQVTDVNGNYVDYTYTGDGELTRIKANDGRQIDLTYSNGVISTVTANGRTWSYTYATGTYGPPLTAVTLPDGRSWSFDLLGLIQEPARGVSCTASNRTVSLTHPNGATGTFVLGETKHGQPYNLGEPNSAGLCNTETKSNAPSNWIEVMSVRSKTLSGPGYPSATWTYSYAGDTGYGWGAGEDEKWTIIADPLGHSTKQYFTRLTDKGDKQVKRETYSNTGATGSPLETATYTYVVEASLGTTYLHDQDRERHTRPVHLDRETITRNGDTWYTDHNYVSSFTSSSYSYGNPTLTERWSNVSTQKRSTSTTYLHKKNIWVLGLPTSVVTNGRTMLGFTYDSLGRYTAVTQYGQPYATYGYHNNGAQAGQIYWVRNALGHQTTLGNYKRGIPRYITRPDGTQLTFSVDDNGWVKSATNALLNTTSYNYNNMGWLTGITPPAGWSPTTITYSGLGGSFTQTETRGATRTVTSYDSFTRPYLVRTQPLSGGGTTTYVKSTFDALGQATFTSFPSASSNPTTGTTITYDALGRTLSEAENVSPFATTNYAYQNQHRRRVQAPDGQYTTYYSSGYGGPGGGDLLQISQPMGVTTTLHRNIWGQLTRLQQAGSHNGYTLDKSQYYYYDSQQRLCRHSTPEGGHTVYEYDAAGRQTKYAKGVASGSSCAVPSGPSLVTTTYDDLGRPTLTAFADSGTHNIERSFDDNGNLRTINRNGINWTYTYGSMDNLETERLQIDGRTYQFTYTYNADGHITQRKLPNNRKVNYWYTGLGQVRKVRSAGQGWMDAGVYHAGGQLSSATFGNGHSYSGTITSRLQPLRTIISQGSTLAVDQTLAYDAMGRVTSLTDLADIGNNRSFGYDALGRLTSASGPWGTGGAQSSGNFTYDPLANIRQKVLGSRTVTVAYDTATNRATSSTDTAGGTRSLAYDARGNVTTLGGLTFSYDMSDQPVSQAGSVPATFTYDGNLKRVKQVMDGKTIYSVYDASGALVLRDNITDNERTDYISIPGGSVRVKNMGAGSSGSGTLSWVHKDHLGSPVVEANASGTLQWRERYSPYGEKLNSVAGNLDRPAFTGHIHDDASGLTYMQARFYDPVIGRFLSIDPVGFTPDQPFMFNRYAYVGNDPVNLTDPTGMCPKCIITGLKVTFKSAVKGKNPIKTAADEFVGIVDDAGTLMDGQLTFADAGAVVDILIGTEFNNPKVRAANKIHGNDKRSPKPQHRYEISDQTGDVKKTGISGQSLNQNGTSSRANSQVNQLNRAGDGNTYSASVPETNIPGRANGLDAERTATNKLSAEGHSLEFQRRPKPDQ